MRILLFIWTFILIGCHSKQTKFSSNRELQEYLNNPDNGYITSQESDDFIFELNFIPALKDDKEPQCTAQLRILRKDGGSVLDFGDVSKQEALEREGYLSFDLKEDVYIDEKGHSNPAIFHHYERNYGLKPSIDVLFHFMHVAPKEDVYFTYRDQLFGQGLIRIKLNKELFTKCYVENA